MLGYWITLVNARSAFINIAQKYRNHVVGVQCINICATVYLMQTSLPAYVLLRRLNEVKIVAFIAARLYSCW